MFTTINRWIDLGFLKLAKNDPYRADVIREKWSNKYDSAIRWAFIPLILLAIFNGSGSGTEVDAAMAQNQSDSISAYAKRFVGAYLKGPTDTSVLREFCMKDVSVGSASGAIGTPIAPGGEATGASSALPSRSVNGFQTWSVVVDTQIPKASQSTDTFYMPLQVDISIDRAGLFCAFTLPHKRPERPAGQPVQIDASFTVSEGNPLYDTVKGFLEAMLTGQGQIKPFIASGSSLSADKPPRFVSVAIEQIRANSELAMAQNVPVKADGVEVTTRITVQLANGVLMPMDYPLSVSVASGHWQVTGINDAPSVLTPDSDSPNSPDGSTTPTTTTPRNQTAPGRSNASTKEGS